MGKSKPIALVALALCGSAALGQDGVPLTLTPVTPWSVDYADNSCALRRTFGSGGQTVQLEMRQFEPGDGFQVTLSSDTLAQTRTNARARFEPDEDSRELTGTPTFDNGDPHRLRFYDSLMPNALERPGEQPHWSVADREAREMAITGYTVSNRFESRVSLATGAMHAPMQALRSCFDQLLLDWGLDPAAQYTLRRKASPTNVQALMRHLPGRARPPRTPFITRLRLIVDADGTQRNCLTDTDSDAPEFEREACTLAQRYVRFVPALDGAGRPVASLAVLNVYFAG